MFIIYETDKFYFFWKPHGLPSTFGKEKSFLDYLKEENEDIYSSIDLSIYDSVKKYIDSSLKKVQNIKSTILHQIQTFTKDEEY
jgi:hypothetical protein